MQFCEDRLHRHYLERRAIPRQQVVSALRAVTVEESVLQKVSLGSEAAELFMLRYR